MHVWIRPPEPAELRLRYAELTREFIEEKETTGKTPSCKWPRIGTEDGGTETIQELLSRHTIEHCSYCDSIMRYSSRDTIDHFQPKSRFPELAYNWGNLYLCCDGCQRKGIDYDPNVLRPDESGYSFAQYFRYCRDGVISVVAINDIDRQRARITITVLKLDHKDLEKNRQQEFNLNLKQRRRPIRPGLDQRTALLRDEAMKVTYDHLPYRDFYAD